MNKLLLFIVVVVVCFCTKIYGAACCSSNNASAGITPIIGNNLYDFNLSWVKEIDYGSVDFNSRPHPLLPSQWTSKKIISGSARYTISELWQTGILLNNNRQHQISLAFEFAPEYRYTKYIPRGFISTTYLSNSTPVLSIFIFKQINNLSYSLASSVDLKDRYTLQWALTYSWDKWSLGISDLWDGTHGELSLLLARTLSENWNLNFTYSDSALIHPSIEVPLTFSYGIGIGYTMPR